MTDIAGKEQPKRRGRPPRDDPEMKVVGIDFNPAPDAQDRLRRLFTILAGLVEDQPPSAEKEQSPDDGGGEEE